jgi:predicted ATP-grasp superfamily ATP-dependent carboligase
MFPNNGHKPTVIVTDASRGSAITIIRSLGKWGCRVIAGDSDPNSIGFRSRYTAECLIYPPPETEPSQMVNTLLQAAIHYKVDLIIPVTDAVILPLSEARAQCVGVCQLAIPDPSALEIVTNKGKTIELAESLEVPTPRTCLVHTAQEAKEAGPSLGWPVVLKPMVSRLFREQASMEAFTVSYAENPDQLARQMQALEGRCPVLLQEYYRGIGLGVELLMHRGQPLAAFQHKRLREIPVSGGASAFRVSVPLDWQLYEYSVRLLEKLNWTGLAMVEFKNGKNGPKLMEINGRVWGSLPLAVWSGMDFPVRLAELYFNEKPKRPAAPNHDYRLGVRSRNLELDILWIATILRGKKRYPFLPIPKRRQAFIAFLELFHPGYKYDILTLQDLRPGLAEIPKIFKKLARKVKEGA